MSELFKKIFRYIPRETPVSIFGWQHWLFIIFIIAAVVILSIVFANKSEKTKSHVLNITAILIISLYVFDFFVQPFWHDGQMAINKLPFHICTLLGVLIPFVNFSNAFKFAKQAVVVWAILAPLMFVLLPLNYINREFEPYSYPIIQTFTFHGLEIFWGVFMLVSKRAVLKWRYVWQPIVGLFPVALWATIGQELYYPNTVGENFLFLRTDISAYAPQWLYIPALFIAAVIVISLLYLSYWLIIKIDNRSKSEQLPPNIQQLNN